MFILRAAGAGSVLPAVVMYELPPSWGRAIRRRRRRRLDPASYRGARARLRRFFRGGIPPPPPPPPQRANPVAVGRRLRSSRWRATSCARGGALLLGSFLPGGIDEASSPHGPPDARTCGSTVRRVSMIGWAAAAALGSKRVGGGRCVCSPAICMPISDPEQHGDLILALQKNSKCVAA
jgi:hypothetical protein